MKKKWWHKGFTLEVMHSEVAVTNPYWAHITEFPSNCPIEIKQSLYDYTFDDDSEDLAVKGLKMVIDRALSIHKDKTKDGKFFYVCE